MVLDIIDRCCVIPQVITRWAMSRKPLQCVYIWIKRQYGTRIRNKKCQMNWIWTCRMRPFLTMSTSAALDVGTSSRRKSSISKAGTTYTVFGSCRRDHTCLSSKRECDKQPEERGKKPQCLVCPTRRNKVNVQHHCMPCAALQQCLVPQCINWIEPQCSKGIHTL